MANLYVDFLNGQDINSGLTFLLRKKTLSSAMSAASPGDTIRVMKSADPTSLGVNGTFTFGSSTLTLSSAVNLTVNLCESNWTASTDVTCTTNNGTFRQGSGSQSIAFGSSFTTGKAAYSSTAVSDYSTMQQITFWIRTNSAISANTFRVDLCSDATGDTAVDSFTIDFDLTANVWIPITIDKGSALGASIQSVAFYCLLDPGTATILLDDIVTATAASSADSLTLNSMVGTNLGTETFQAIRSISGTTVILDNNPGLSGTPRGYGKLTKTTTVYKRECIKSPISFGTYQTASNSGTSGNLISISGGWNTTDMSTQTGETWVDGRIGQGTAYSVSGSYLNIEKLTGVRYNYAFTISGYVISGSFGGNNNGDNAILVIGGDELTFDVSSATANNIGFYHNPGNLYFRGNNLYNCDSNESYGFYSNTGRSFTATGVIDCNNNGSDGSRLDCSNFLLGTISASGNVGDGVRANQNTRYSEIKSLTSCDNDGYGISLYSNAVTVRNFRTDSNTAAVLVNSSRQVEHILQNAVMSEATKVSGLTNFLDIRVFTQNEGGVHNNNVMRSDGFTVTVNTSDPHTPGGIAYQLQPTSTNRSAYYPGTYRIRGIGCKSTGTVTVGLYAKKSHNTNVVARMYIPGGQIAGVPNDVSTTITGTSYSQFTVSFTPTEQAAVDLILEVYTVSGTSDYVLISDLSVNQS